MSMLSVQSTLATLRSVDSLALGCVDGFDQDERRGEGDDSAEVSSGFLAAQGDAFEAFERADGPLDPGSAAIQGFGERLGVLVSAISAYGASELISERRGAGSS